MVAYKKMHDAVSRPQELYRPLLAKETNALLLKQRQRALVANNMQVFKCHAMQMLRFFDIF